jgi:RNA polymerase sigma-70 factor (ECF subfamily)
MDSSAPSPSRGPAEEVVQRAQAGDRAALEVVLTSLAPSIRRFGLRMCKNAHDADDVLQDTLIAISRHLPELEGRSSLSSWVFALTRSACARRRRGLKNQPPVDDTRVADTADAAPSPESRLGDRELAAALSSAIDGLSEDHREVIALRDIEGLSAAEAASALGISVDALKSRLHRAREALRTSLKPWLEPQAARAPAGCPNVAVLWSKKLEGELDQADCAAMERHLETCPACSAACDALKQALVICRRVAEEDVPPEVQERVKRAMRAWMTSSAV